MLGLSSSGLLAQSSIVHHPQVPASWNNRYSANPVHVGLRIQGACFRIGTADNPVTVAEYVTFLNSQHSTGNKQLAYWESWNPMYYAKLQTHQVGHFYDRNFDLSLYDPCFDNILMNSDPFEVSYIKPSN